MRKEHWKKIALKVTALTIAASTLGCDTKPSVTPVPVKPPTTPTLTLEQMKLSDLPIDVAAFYPEAAGIATAGYKSIYLDPSDSVRAPVAVHNFTDMSLDRQALVSLFQFIENFSSDKKNLFRLHHEYNGKKRDFAFSQKDNVGLRSVVIVPDGAPKPQQAVGGPKVDLTDISEFTVLRVPKEAGRKGVSFTFIEAKKRKGDLFNDYQKGTTSRLVNQTCQSGYKIDIYDTDGKPIYDRREFLSAQIRVCDSLGAAIVEKISGDPYEDYISRVNKTNEAMRKDEYETGYVTFPKEFYENIPLKRSIIQ